MLILKRIVVNFLKLGNVRHTSAVSFLFFVKGDVAEGAEPWGEELGLLWIARRQTPFRVQILMFVQAVILPNPLWHYVCPLREYADISMEFKIIIGVFYELCMLGK